MPIDIAISQKSLSGKVWLPVMLAAVGLVALVLFAVVIHETIHLIYKRHAISAAEDLAQSYAKSGHSADAIHTWQVALLQMDQSGVSLTNNSGVPAELIDVLNRERDNKPGVQSGIVKVAGSEVAWAEIPGDTQGGDLIAVHRVWHTDWRTLGPPFAILGFLMIWVLVWSGVTVGALVEKTHAQNKALRERTEELRHARDHALQSDQSKSLFLANMSHEIRTPMTGILGFSDLLLRLQLPDTERGYVTRIHDASNHLLGIINDLLDLSKLEATEMSLEPVDVHLSTTLTNCMAALEMQAQRKGLQFDLSVGSNVPDYVRMDPVRIGQILINLVGNAVKFTQSGGVAITIDVEPGDGCDWRMLWIIEDTGIGMSTDQIQRVFTRYAQGDQSTTRVFGGTGLGLPISHELVELMGGQIEVESKLE